MANMTRRAVLRASVGASVAIPLSAVAAPIPIVGGGSSFVRPVMAGWVKAAQAHDLNVRYEVLGTGAAQNQILAGDIDFAAVELPMSPDKLAMGNLIQVPVVFGGMTLVVNIDGVADGELRLDATLLGGIFSGGIRNWADPRIAAANPGRTLPNVDIHPVFLGDPSGSVFSTSTTLARYLIATNADWRARYPTGLRTRWATGSMVPDAAAMVPVVAARSGGIGFMALGTALANKLPMVKLVNKGGETVGVGPEGVGAAVAHVDWKVPGNMVVDATDLPGAGVWPLVLPTYAIFPRNPRNKARGAAVREFLSFAIDKGTDSAIASHGVPLPNDARRLVADLLSAA